MNRVAANQSKIGRCYKMLKFLVMLSTILLSSSANKFNANLTFVDEPDYYWTEYEGLIPPDALIAGRDAKGQYTYIGQGCLKNVGLMPGRIKAGVQKMAVSYDSDIYYIDKYIKILCGPSRKFYWLKVNSSAFHTLTFDKHAVIGGHQDVPQEIKRKGQKMEYNVGRIKQGNVTIFGRVDTFRHIPKFYWANIKNNTEGIAKSFEVLLYNKGANVKDTETRNERNDDDDVFAHTGSSSTRASKSTSTTEK